MYGSVLVDVPSSRFASDEEWLDFLREMKSGRTSCKPNEKSAIKTLDSMISLAEKVLSDRGAL